MPRAAVDDPEPAGADLERRIGAAQPVADIGFGAGPTKIERSTSSAASSSAPTSATIRASPSSRRGDEADQRSADHEEPADRRQRMTVGQAKWQAEMINNFIVALVAGIFLVFAVLVLLYRRFMPPFVNMGSLLLAPLGGLLALLVAGNPMSMPVYIGMLMLLGIVAKNSILLIDFALEEMAKGVDKFTRSSMPGTSAPSRS
jgi:multidrug efflux pump subunit AcrB